MHKNLLAIAALVFAGGNLIQSIRTASAQSFGPAITGGELPWVSFTGSTPACDFGDVYTVPSDRVLILTGAAGGSTLVDLYVDGSLLVHGGSEAMTNSDVHLMIGNAHVPVASGSTLQVYGNNCSYGGYPYAIQGYLAHP